MQTVILVLSTSIIIKLNLTCSRYSHSRDHQTSKFQYNYLVQTEGTFASARLSLYLSQPYAQPVRRGTGRKTNVRDFMNKTTVLIFAGYLLPHSSHAHQAYAYATKHCHVTHRRHAHTVTPARALEWLLLSYKRSHARHESCACTQVVRAHVRTYKDRKACHLKEC
eukprot:6178961-Pleurochrysis_carterae.AAC.7